MAHRCHGHPRISHFWVSMRAEFRLHSFVIRRRSDFLIIHRIVLSSVIQHLSGACLNNLDEKWIRITVTARAPRCRESHLETITLTATFKRPRVIKAISPDSLDIARQPRPISSGLPSNECMGKASTTLIVDTWDDDRRDVLDFESRGSGLITTASFRGNSVEHYDKGTYILPNKGLVFTNEDFTKMVPDNARRLSGIDTLPETFVLVVIDYGSCLCVESSQTLAKRFDVIV